MRRIIEISSNVLLYSFAGIALILLILNLVGIKPYITISGSMEPTIKTGSICFVNINEQYKDVKINDIIAFEAGNNNLVTHRVLNIDENGIETKGDNNQDADFIKTNESNFVGKTLFSIPYIGYLTMFFKKPIGILVIAIILILLFVPSFLKNKTTKQQV